MTASPRLPGSGGETARGFPAASFGGVVLDHLLSQEPRHLGQDIAGLRVAWAQFQATLEVGLRTRKEAGVQAGERIGEPIVVLRVLRFELEGPLEGLRSPEEVLLVSAPWVPLSNQGAPAVAPSHRAVGVVLQGLLEDGIRLLEPVEVGEVVTQDCGVDATGPERDGAPHRGLRESLLPTQLVGQAQVEVSERLVQCE